MGNENIFKITLFCIIKKLLYFVLFKILLLYITLLYTEKEKVIFLFSSSLELLKRDLMVVELSRSVNSAVKKSVTNLVYRDVTTF